MNKKDTRKIKGEYHQLQLKIFARTAIIMFAAIVLTFVVYNAFLEGRFADAIVRLIDRFFFHDYEYSLYIYAQVFRNNRDIFIMITILVIFLIILRIYLMSFTKYFNEINRGIDALVEENAGDVSLSPELAVTERKINYIKHTLEQRKLASDIAEQRKNDLVVYLAHDLKTPLTSVIGYLTLLHDENQISDELKEKYLSISLEKAERLEDLINEFFEITRFSLSNITLEYSSVNLTRLLEQLTFEFKPMFLEKNLNCILQTEPDTMITFDVDKMQRVFDNLLRNAVNYSFENSAIHIVVMQNEQAISIRFMNHGYTIPPEKLTRIFEQFYRLDTARSSRSGGAGLGLAIAKEIVELHHGTITAHSNDDRIEFTVTLPV